MGLLDELLATLPEGPVVDLRVGLNWTAVVVEVEGVRQCGLSSTLRGARKHGEPIVPEAGRLVPGSGRAMANLVRDPRPTMASIGAAALNALLPRQPEAWHDRNAEHILAECGAGKRVALIGHFPFIPRLRDQVAELVVLEQRPRDGELAAEAAAEVLPRSEVVAITGMTLANHTLEGLLGLCAPETVVIVLGPSTPLSPILFSHGVDLLSGAVVTAIDPVLRAVSQGANFPQVHQAGVRLVNLGRPGIGWTG